MYVCQGAKHGPSLFQGKAGIFALPIGKNSLRQSKTEVNFFCLFSFTTVYDTEKSVMQNIYFLWISECANVCGFVCRAKTVVDFWQFGFWQYMVSVNTWMRFFPGLYVLLKSRPIIQVICMP